MKNRKKKLSVVMSMLCVFALLLSACGTSESTDTGSTEARTVRICTSDLYVSAAEIIMREKNLLDSYLPENVNVEWSAIASGPDIRDALVSNSVDIADFSLMTFISAHENGLPLTLVSFSGGTPISVYSHDKNIKSLSDFKKGDAISITNKNTNLHIAFLALCKKDLGDAMALDENLTAIPAADALSSLETADDYAGAVFSFPMSVKADKLESLTKLADMTEQVNEYNIGDAAVARTEFYNENSDIVEAYVKAQEEAVAYIIEKPEEAAEILAPVFGCETEDVVAAIQEMPPTNKISGYDKQAELLYEAGILEKEPDKFEDLENYDKIVK